MLEIYQNIQLRRRNWRRGLNLLAPCVLYIRTGVSLLSRERFLYI